MIPGASPQLNPRVDYPDRDLRFEKRKNHKPSRAELLPHRFQCTAILPARTSNERIALLSFTHMKNKINSLIHFLRFAPLPLITWALPAQGYDMPVENNASLEPSRYVAVNKELTTTTLANKTTTEVNYVTKSVTFDSLKVLPSYDEKGQAFTGYDDFCFEPGLAIPFGQDNAAGEITILKTDIFGTAPAKTREFKITLSGRNLPDLVYPTVSVQDAFSESQAQVASRDVINKSLGVYLNSKLDSTVRLVWPLSGEKYYRVCAIGVHRKTRATISAKNLHEVYFYADAGLAAFQYKVNFGAIPVSEFDSITYNVYELSRAGSAPASVLRSKTVSVTENQEMPLYPGITSKLDVVAAPSDAGGIKTFALTLPDAFIGTRARLIAFETTNGLKLSSKLYNSGVAKWEADLPIDTLRESAKHQFSLLPEEQKNFGDKVPVFFRLISYDDELGSPQKVWESESPVYLTSGPDLKTGINDFVCQLNGSNCDYTVSAFLPAKRTKPYTITFFRSTQPGLVKQSILQLAGFNPVEQIMINTTDVGSVDSDTPVGMVKFERNGADKGVIAGETYYYRAVLNACEDVGVWDPIVRLFGTNRIFRKDQTVKSESSVVVGLSRDEDINGGFREIINKQAFVGFAFDRDLVVTDGTADRNRWFAEDATAHLQLNDLLGLLGNKTDIRVGGKYVDHFQASVNTYADKEFSELSVTAFLRTIITNGGGSFGLPTVKKDNEAPEAYVDRLRLEASRVADIFSGLPGFQKNLLKWELGNEPDWLVQEANYSQALNYPIDYEAYKSEVGLIKKSISKLGGFGFVGPSTASHFDKSLIDWTLRAPRDWFLDETTLHYYWRSSNHVAHLSSVNLLKPDQSLHNALQSLEQAGGKFRLNEVATCYNGGVRGLSDSHASALWAVNFMLLSASHGAAGVNFQSGYSESKSSYSPFYSNEVVYTVGGRPVKKRVVAQINPTFFAMYAMSKALDTGSLVGKSGVTSPVYIKNLKVAPALANSEFTIDSYAKPNPLATGRKLNFDAFQIKHANSRVVVLVNNEEKTSVGFNYGAFGSSFTLLKLAPAVGCSLSSSNNSARLATTINDIVFPRDLLALKREMINGGGFVEGRSSGSSIINVPPGSAYFLKFDSSLPVPPRIAPSVISTNNNQVSIGFAPTLGFSIYTWPISSTKWANLGTSLNRFLPKVSNYSLLGNSGILFNGLNDVDAQGIFGLGTAPYGVKDKFAPLKGTGPAFIPNIVSDGNLTPAAKFTLTPGFFHSLNISLLPPTAAQGLATPVVFSGKGTVNLNARNNLGGPIVVRDGATLKLADSKLDFFRSTSSSGGSTNTGIRNPEFLLGGGGIVLGVEGGQNDQGGVLDLNTWPRIYKSIVVKGRGNVIKNGGLSPGTILVLETGAELTLKDVKGSGKLQGDASSLVVVQGDVELSTITAFKGVFKATPQTDKAGRYKSLKVTGDLNYSQKFRFHEMFAAKEVSALPSYLEAKVLADPLSNPNGKGPSLVTFSGKLMNPDGSEGPLPPANDGTISADMEALSWGGQRLGISLVVNGAVILFPQRSMVSNGLTTLASNDYRITCQLYGTGELYGMLYKGGDPIAFFQIYRKFGN